MAMGQLYIRGQWDEVLTEYIVVEASFLEKSLALIVGLLLTPRALIRSLRTLQLTPMRPRRVVFRCLSVRDWP
jgi:hypothetical protein